MTDIIIQKIIVLSAIVGFLGGYSFGLISWRREFGQYEFVAPLLLGIAGVCLLPLFALGVIFLVFA